MKTPSPGAPSSTNHHEFRESWLRAATNELRPYFASAGYSIPENIRFAIGFTSTGRNGNRQSESWHASSSADNTYEIFIRPDIAEPIKVLSKLVKELVHTTLPDGSGHGQLFRNAALKIGLLPPMRSAEPAPHLIQETRPAENAARTLAARKARYQHQPSHRGEPDHAILRQSHPPQWPEGTKEPYVQSHVRGCELRLSCARHGPEGSRNRAAALSQTWRHAGSSARRGTR